MKSVKKKKKKKLGHDAISPDSEVIASAQRPTVPRERYSYMMNGYGYRLFRNTDWDEWWDDFNESIDKDGRPKFKTIWAFIKDRSKNKVDRKLYYEMIGPRPEVLRGRELRVPWLGDWQSKRSKSFWSVEDPLTMKKLRHSIKQQTDAVVSARAVTPVVAQQIGRFTRLLEKIDNAFGGEVFLPHLAPNHPKNKNRFKAYISMVNAASKGQQQAMYMWFKAHGLDPSQPEAWLSMALLATGKVAAGAAIAGHRAGAMGVLGSLLNENDNGNGNNVTDTDVLIAQQMRRKAAVYNLPTPSDWKTIEASEESETKQRTH